MNELELHPPTWINLTNTRLNKKKKKGSCSGMSIVYHLFKAREYTKQCYMIHFNPCVV